MARSRRIGWVRLGDGRGRTHPQVSRVALGRHHATDRPHGVGQRSGSLGEDRPGTVCNFVAALSAGDGVSGRGTTGREFLARSLASLGVSSGRRYTHRAAIVRCPRQSDRGHPLAPRFATLWTASAGGSTAAFRSRLSSLTPREPGLSVRCHGSRRTGDLAAVSRRSPRHGAGQWHLCARSRVVSELHVFAGARTRTR